MWSAIKKALNSTLGKSYGSTLDELGKKNAYIEYANFVNCLSSKITSINNKTTYHDYMKAFPYGYSKRYGGQYNNYTNQNSFVPYGVEEIYDSFSGKKGLVYIPRTVKEIGETCFRGSSYIVVIDNKKGNISGHPWGHDEDKILYLED